MSVDIFTLKDGEKLLTDFYSIITSISFYNDFKYLINWAFSELLFLKAMFYQTCYLIHDN